MDSLRGRLLIASPVLVDPNFHRTVVLIAEHTDEGAMGLVLNRPAETLVAEAVPDLSELADSGAPLYVLRSMSACPQTPTTSTTSSPPSPRA